MARPMLKDRLADDLKNAMRAKDDVRLRTIRSLRAALMEKEIELRKGGVGSLSEEQELAVLQKQAKQRRDSIEQYEKAERQDLSDKEREELDIIEEYLPRQLSDQEIREVIQDVIQSTGAESRADMGKVMGSSMQKLRGRAEGKKVQQIAQELLS